MSKARKSSGRFKNVIINIAFSVAVLLVVLALFEVVFRTTHLFGARISWAQPDPVIGWRFVPDCPYWFDEENDHPITGRINRFGWRDRERELAKSSNSYRIAVLGDSFVEAFQVESDSTFLTITERMLREETNYAVELMNFGRMGMTQSEQYLVLQNDAVQFSPDMVVLFFLPENDIRDISRKTAVDDLRPYYNVSEEGELILDTSFTDYRQYKLKTYISPFKKRFALVSFLMEKYNQIQWSFHESRGQVTTASQIEIAGFLTLCTAQPHETYVENYRLNKILIREMADFCKDRDIEFLLVCINTLWGCEDEDKYKAIDPTFESAFFDRDLRAFADSIDVDYLGLEEPFTRHCRETGESWHWNHWNYTGHREVSVELCRKLNSYL